MDTGDDDPLVTCFAIPQSVAVTDLISVSLSPPWVGRHQPGCLARLQESLPAHLCFRRGGEDFASP